MSKVLIAQCRGCQAIVEAVTMRASKEVVDECRYEWDTQTLLVSEVEGPVTIQACACPAIIEVIRKRVRILPHTLRAELAKAGLKEAA